MGDILLCTFCKVKWEAPPGGTPCPECNRHSFFMLRAGDIGTAMHFDQTGDDPSKYRWVEMKEKGHE